LRILLHFIHRKYFDDPRFAVCAVDAASGKITKVTASHYCTPSFHCFHHSVCFLPLILPDRLPIWKARKELDLVCPPASGCFREATLLLSAPFVVRVRVAAIVFARACLTIARWSRLHRNCVNSEWINAVFDL
jgi:hypothetical protein